MTEVAEPIQDVPVKEEKSEAMEVSVDEIKTEEEPAPVVNGTSEDAVEVKEEATSPIVKKASHLSYLVQISGLPRYYTFSDLKKYLKEKHKLRDFRFLNSSRKPGSIQIAFTNPDNQKRALKVVNFSLWRKCVLHVSEVSDSQKRKQEGGNGDGESKKARIDDLSIEEQVLAAVIPLHEAQYEEQLKQKMANLKATVSKMGLFAGRRNKCLTGHFEEEKKKNADMPFAVEEIRPSPVIDEYRNKNEFKFGYNAETKELFVGIYIQNFSDDAPGVGPITGLRHLPKRMCEAVKVVEKYVIASGYPRFDNETKTGVWYSLSLRVTTTDELMIVMVVHPQELGEAEIDLLKKDVTDYFSNREGKDLNVESLYVQLYKEKNLEDPQPPVFDHLLGKTYIEEVMAGISFHLDPSSYFPSNTKAYEAFIGDMGDLMKLNEETVLVNLTRGCASTLCLAKRCQKVILIEGIASGNIDEFKACAVRNDITNCDFYTGKLNEILEKIAEELAAAKEVIVILDLPRFGHQTIVEIRKIKNANKLLFLRNSTKAMMRQMLDLVDSEGKGNLEGHMFVPVKCISVDNFPHTQNYQMAILMERMDPAKLPKPVSVPGSNQKMRIRGGRSRNSRRSGIRGSYRGAYRNRQIPSLLSQQKFFGPSSVFSSNDRSNFAPFFGNQDYSNQFNDSRYSGRSDRSFSNRSFGPGVRDSFSDPFRRSGGPNRFGRYDMNDDEMSRNRYSDFRRDFEEAIDSSYSPRSRNMMEAAILAREERAYRAGLTRGIVGAATLGPIPDLYSNQSGWGMGGGSGGGIGSGGYSGNRRSTPQRRMSRGSRGGKGTRGKQRH